MAAMALDGKVAIVTGASRGIGKGIAVQLAKAGCIVYITGRTQTSTTNAPGSLDEAVAEICVAAKGRGKCIGVLCDHSNDADVEALFDRVEREHGCLDILVNNAYGAVNTLMETTGKKFWQKSPSVWDASNNVGLRSHYVASVFAARRMVPKKKGLIINISSVGGLRYAAFATDVAYGVGKSALDRMSADIAHELRKDNVACISLWPGAVQTELMQAKVKAAQKSSSETPQKPMDFSSFGETTEFAGAAVVALARRPEAAMSKTGRVVLTTELAEEFGFTDLNGKVPPSHAAGTRDVMKQPPRQWQLAAQAKL